jgi:hypothetical protein
MNTTEDYLTMEFLNDLYIFDFDEFVKLHPKKNEIEVFCMEFDPDINTKQFECAICMETQPAMESVVLKCKHTFCYSCISNYITHNKQNHKKSCCALCRESFTTLEIPDLNHMLSIMDIVNSK